MAINQNHLFEDLDGVKCGIVEKNVPAQRVVFLRSLLVFNGYTVMVVPSPPPKPAPPAAAAPASVSTQVPVATAAQASTVTPAASSTPDPIPPPLPETFTVGVTDTTFNSINAIFGRLLRTPDGHIVTLAYWHGTETESHDEIPYFETGKS